MSYLLKIFGTEGNTGQLLPDRRSKIQIKRLLCSDGNTEQDSKEAKQAEVFDGDEGSIEKEPVSVVPYLIGRIRRRYQEWNYP